MSKFNNRLTLALALCVALFLTASCSLFRKSSRARVNTLIVTGNYMKPRLLAELAQYRSKQPIILCQQDGADIRLFYLDGNQKSDDIAASKFRDFVEFLNPRTIVFMGDENYVPASLVEQIKGGFRVMTLTSDDWEKNAQMLGEIMNQPKLNRLFKEYLDKYAQVNAIQESK